MLIKSCYALSGDSLVFWTWVALKFSQGFIGAWSEDGCINKITEGYITTQGHAQSSSSEHVFIKGLGLLSWLKKMI